MILSLIPIKQNIKGIISRNYFNSKFATWMLLKLMALGAYFYVRGYACSQSDYTVQAILNFAFGASVITGSSFSCVLLGEAMISYGYQSLSCIIGTCWYQRVAIVLLNVLFFVGVYLSCIPCVLSCPELDWTVILGTAVVTLAMVMCILEFYNFTLTLWTWLIDLRFRFKHAVSLGNMSIGKNVLSYEKSPPPSSANSKW